MNFFHGVRHSCVYVRVCACIYLRMYVCVCVHVSMYVCMYMCMYVCICIYVCVYVCMHVDSLSACVYVDPVRVCEYIHMCICMPMGECVGVNNIHTHAFSLWICCDALVSSSAHARGVLFCVLQSPVTISKLVNGFEVWLCHHEIFSCGRAIFEQQGQSRLPARELLSLLLREFSVRPGEEDEGDVEEGEAWQQKNYSMLVPEPLFLWERQLSSEAGSAGTPAVTFPTFCQVCMLSVVTAPFHFPLQACRFSSHLFAGYSGVLLSRHLLSAPSQPQQLPVYV